MPRFEQQYHVFVRLMSTGEADIFIGHLPDGYQNLESAVIPMETQAFVLVKAQGRWTALPATRPPCPAMLRMKTFLSEAAQKHTP